MIPSRRPLGQMADQTISGQLKLSDAHACAFHFPLVDARRLNVRDEVGFPDMLHARLVALLPLIKKTVGARVTIGKIVRAVENEIFVMNNIHHHRSVGNSEKLYRRRPTVEQAMPSIERRREETPWA